MFLERSEGMCRWCVLSDWWWTEYGWGLFAQYFCKVFELGALSSESRQSGKISGTVGRLDRREIDDNFSVSEWRYDYINNTWKI